MYLVHVGEVHAIPPIISITCGNPHVLWYEEMGTYFSSYSTLSMLYSTQHQYVEHVQYVQYSLSIRSARISAGWLLRFLIDYLPFPHLVTS